MGACLFATCSLAASPVRAELTSPAALTLAPQEQPANAEALSQQAVLASAFLVPGFTPAADARLRLRVEAIAWYMAPGGELRMPRATGESQTFDIDPLGFDTPQMVPVPEVSIHAPARAEASSWLGRRGWRVGGRAFVFGDDHTEASTFAGQVGESALSVGETVRSSLDYTSTELEAAVNVHSYASSATNEAGVPNVSSTLEAIVGLQAIDCDWSVTIDGLTQSTGANSVGGLVGGKLAYAFDDRFLVDVTITASFGLLGDDMAAADVIIGGSYMFSRNVGVQIGYRSAFFSLTGDEPGTTFEYTGSHQGLMFGLAMRF
jgi:hypothetical protein